jgi:uncharacterized cupredoxin-like copper-binding protein
MRLLTTRRALTATLAASALGAGVAVHAHAGSTRTTSIRVIERDFKITAPRRVPSGEVDVTVVNKGPDDHELIVVRAGDKRLPLRADGVTVDEKKLEPDTLPSLEPGPPGSSRTFRLHLRPGTYTLLCNMAGHFMAGMRATLVVR